MIFLWDANVLIARVFPEHPHHRVVRAWTDDNPSFAVCPITEGALVRYALRASEYGASLAERSLASLEALPGYQFWADSISYRATDLQILRGHKQATDAYLVALAAENGGMLASFDQALVSNFPSALLITSI